MNEIQIHQHKLPARADQFVASYCPKSCLLVFSKINTTELCIASKLPSLAILKKAYGNDFTLAYLELWLDNLNDFLNVKRKLTPSQMQEIAIFIYQDYYYFKLTDINLVFSKIKKGEYGQFYETLDGPKIIAAFEKYAADRISTAVIQNNAETDKYYMSTSDCNIVEMKPKHKGPVVYPKGNKE